MKRFLWFYLGMVAMVNLVQAGERPVIGIIIDDVGRNLETGRMAIGLPGDVAISLLPHRRYSEMLAKEASASGKEVMLHLPMETLNGEKLGAGGLTMEMSKGAYLKSIYDSLQTVPEAVGINNHMGSLLTQHPVYMSWLMEILAQNRGFFFVDSKTSAASVAGDLAAEMGVPTVDRHVFLDNEINLEYVSKAFGKLIKRAHAKGFALAIGHPYRTTLNFLESAIPELEKMGVELVPISSLTHHQAREDGLIPVSFPAQTLMNSQP